MKKIQLYFSKHFWFSVFALFVLGMGVGILITYPIVGSHPVRLGVALLALGLIGCAYPLSIKK